MDIDARSIKIIKSRYWSSKGWIRDGDRRSLSEADAAYLAEQNLDLTPVKKTHDALIGDILEMSGKVSLGHCASLLSKSLPSRKLQDRSCLSSALQAKAMPEHTYTSGGACPICGLYAEQVVKPEVMLFEKLMWGGVRLTDSEYIWLDLCLMGDGGEPQDGVEELQELLCKIAKIKGRLSASKFAASLKDIKGNKAEREVLCGILGICDILQHPEHPGFLDRYRPVDERELPDQHFIDLEWPFCWYNGEFGVNQSSIKRITSSGANKSVQRTPLGGATDL